MSRRGGYRANAGKKALPKFDASTNHTLISMWSTP